MAPFFVFHILIFTCKPLNEFATMFVFTGLHENMSGEFNFVLNCVNIAVILREYHIECYSFTPKEVILLAVDLQLEM